MSRNAIKAIEMDNRNSNTLDGTFQVLNAGGLPKACTIIKIVNDSDRDVLISYDGVTDHDYVPLGDKLELNLQANSQPNGYASSMAQGTVFYVRGLAGGTGYIYLVGYYNEKN